MVLERGWKVEQVGESYQIGGKKEESNWHHREVNRLYQKHRGFYNALFWYRVNCLL